jgi:hypothetical protein
MATIGTLLFEIGANVARLRTDMASARSTVEGAMDGITRAANVAKSALAAVGVGASLEGVRRFVTGAIEAQNALYELNLRTGISVETLSGLRGVARAAGTDMESMGTMVQKLEKNLMVFGDTGKGKAAAAFQAIGVSQKEAQAGMRNMDAFLPELARKLLSVGNEAQQSALSMMLIGKGGGDAIKFLHELAGKMELQGTTTAEAAKQAHEYEQQMALMTTQSDKFKVSIANGVLPALTGMLEVINALNTAGGMFSRGYLSGNDVKNAGARIVELEDKLAKLRDTQAELAKPTLANKLNSIFAPEDAAMVATQINLLETELAALKKVQNARLEAESRGSVHKGRRGDVSLADDGQKEIDNLKAQHDAIMQVARDAEAAAEAETKLAEVQQRIANTSVDVYEAYTKAAAAFRAGTLGEEENLATVMTTVAAKAKETQDWARQMGLTFSSAFEDAIVKGKTAGDVLKGIEQDIGRIILRQTFTEPAGKAISGAVSGINWGSLFGGSSSAPASVPSYDVGTPYVPQDQLAMVHQGERIIPAGQSAGGDRHVHLHVVAMDARSFMAYKPLILSMVRQGFNGVGAVSPIG